MLYRLPGIVIFIFPLLFGAHVSAQSIDSQITAEQFLASLKFQEGKIKLPGSIATLNLPNSFRYLAPNDTERVLTQGWGNPPGPATLGMILPTAVNPLGANGWGVIITYEEDGHVNDNDADSIDYDTLLKEMQEAMLQESEERKNRVTMV